MKKFVFSVMVMLLLVSCTSDEYYNVKLDVHTEKYTVYRDKTKPYFWETEQDATGLYYYCSIKEPNLTHEVFQTGQMNAFLYYKSAFETSVLSPLPFSDFLQEFDDRGNLIGQWEEHITVEFEVGYVTFIVKADDHDPTPPHFNAYEFVVSFIK